MFSLPGFRLRVADQVGDRVDLRALGLRRVQHQHVRGRPATSTIGTKSFDRVERHLRIERSVDRVRADGAHQQRVAVGRRLRDDVPKPRLPPAPGLVVDDEGLAECLAELGGEGTRQDGRSCRRARMARRHRTGLFGQAPCAMANPGKRWPAGARRRPAPSSRRAASKVATNGAIPTGGSDMQETSSGRQTCRWSADECVAGSCAGRKRACPRRKNQGSGDCSCRGLALDPSRPARSPWTSPSA